MCFSWSLHRQKMWIICMFGGHDCGNYGAGITKIPRNNQDKCSQSLRKDPSHYKQVWSPSRDQVFLNVASLDSSQHH